MFTTLQWDLNDSFRRAPFEETRPETFDLINSRFLVDGIDEQRWTPLIKEYKALLREKGWLQMVELEWTFHSDSNQDLPHLTRWSNAYSLALRRTQKDPGIAGRLERIMRLEAAFEQVEVEVRNIRLGGWPSGMRPCVHISLRLMSSMR